MRRFIFLSALPALSALVMTCPARAQSYGQQQGQPYGTTQQQPGGQPQQPYGATQQPNYGQQQPNMSAGGLAPPDPLRGNVQQNGPTNETERELEEAEKKDSGRGLEWFFLEPEVGYEWIGLETFKSDGLTYAKQVSTRDSGLMVGGTAGLRLVFLTLGARARLGMFDQWNVATFDGEAGVRFPLGSVEPYLSLGAGYAYLGSMDTSGWGADDVEISGWNARAGFGLNIYVTNVLTIGANVTGEALFLKRPGVNLSSATSSGGSGSTAEQLDEASRKLAQADGTGVGGALTASFVAGLHF